MKNKIGWCDKTINFFTGCRNGCPYCYARKMAHRLAHIEGTIYALVKRTDPSHNEFAPAWHGGVAQMASERLTEWYQVRGGARRYRTKPLRIFVGSMGDMCFEGAARLFDGVGSPQGIIGTKEVQHLTSRWATHVEPAGHKVLLLTKRPDLLCRDVRSTANAHLGVSVTGNEDAGRIAELHRWYGRAERDEAWNERKPGVLWASVEPLLDPDFDPDCLAGLDWVVVGLDSSPGVLAKKLRNGTLAAETLAIRRIKEWCDLNDVPLWCKDSVSRWVGGVWPQDIAIGL